MKTKGIWPDLEITSDRDIMLGLQLLCWGLVQYGSEPPDNFVEWLDEAYKVTGAYTSVECLELADKILHERKRKEHVV